MASEDDDTIEELVYAIKEHNFELCKSIVQERDIDINERHTETGRTLLHECVGQNIFLLEILKYGPVLDIFDKEGYTPLHIAARDGFTESLFILVAHGADINAKYDANVVDIQKEHLLLHIPVLNKPPRLSSVRMIENSPTPLDLALQDDFTQTTSEYLQFLGAQLSQKATGSTEKHEQIIHGYESGKIFFEGRTVSSGSASHFEKLDINVKNRSPTQINFFCRRIEQQYQDNENFTPKVPIPTEVSGQTEALRQDELRSDIFQIKMDEPGTVDITVPVYHCRENRANYPGLIVKVSHKTTESQDRVEEFSIIEYMNGKVKIKNVGVGIDDGIPLASVAVFHRIQIDTASVQANTQHTLTSTTDNNFKVSTTENTFQEETKVNLQVLKVEEETESSTEDVVTHTDFCSVTSSKQPEEDIITIFIPKPRGQTQNGYQHVAMSCNQADKTEYPQNWHERTEDITETPNGWNLPNSKFGTYIGLIVKKIHPTKLKRLVCQLFSMVLGKSVCCTLFAMTRELNLNASSTRQFILRCVLCRFDLANEVIERHGQHNFVLEKCVKSRNIKISTCVKYYVSFEIDYGKLASRINRFSIQYQADHDNFTDAIVEASTGSRNPTGRAYLVEREFTTAEIRDFSFGRHLKVCVPIVFTAVRNEDHPGEFLNNTLLKKISKMIGSRWFELFVHIGVQIQEVRAGPGTPDAIFLQLKQWREMKVNADDRGVKDLIIGLTNTDLRDTRNMIVKELQNYVSRPAIDEQSSFYSWLSTFQNTEGQVQIDCKRLCREAVMSPFDDRFLYCVSEWIVPCDEIPLSLGLKHSKSEDMKNIIPASRRICEKLHLLRRAEKGDNPWKFTEKLIKEIKSAKNYQAVEDIRQTIQDWYNTGPQDIPTKTLESIRKWLKSSH